MTEQPEPIRTYPSYREAFRSLMEQTVTRVCLDQWSVTLVFETAVLTIEGVWQFVNTRLTEGDSSVALAQRGGFQLWRAVGQAVQGMDFSDAEFTRVDLHLSGEWTLILLGDEDGYEDWSLTSL